MIVSLEQQKQGIMNRVKKYGVGSWIEEILLYHHTLVGSQYEMKLFLRKMN